MRRAGRHVSLFSLIAMNFFGCCFSSRFFFRREHLIYGSLALFSLCSLRPDSIERVRIMVDSLFCFLRFLSAVSAFRVALSGKGRALVHCVGDKCAVPLEFRFFSPFESCSSDEYLPIVRSVKPVRGNGTGKGRAR